MCDSDPHLVAESAITLICDDLNWTSREIKGKTPILDALDKKAKDKELVLYLKYLYFRH